MKELPGNPTKAKLLTATGILLVAAWSAAAEISLTDLQGRKASVEILEATPDKLSILMQGRKASVALASLTAESRTAALEYAKSKGVYRTCPPLVVQVKVARQQRNSENAWYKKDVRITPSVIVDGVNKLTGIPPLEACILIVTQDTRQKYAKRKEKLRVHLVDKITIPAAPTGSRREFDFRALELTMDSARDASNLGGDEYKYFVFGLREVGSGQLVDFQTNCPSLQTYVAAHPEARDTVLSARVDAAFSEDFAGH